MRKLGTWVTRPEGVEAFQEQWELGGENLTYRYAATNLSQTLFVLLNGHSQEKVSSGLIPLRINFPVPSS